MTRAAADTLGPVPRLAAAFALVLGLAAAGHATDLGIVAGADRRQTAAAGPGWLTGPQVGFALSDPGRTAFWQYVAGWARDRATGWDVRWLDARLAVTIANWDWGLLEAGTGAGVEWLDRGDGRGRAGSYEAEAGFSLVPGAILEKVWPQCPCFPCLFAPKGPACRGCAQAVVSRRVLDRVQGTRPVRRLYLGVEGGYRRAAAAVTGAELRAFLLWFP